MYFIESLIHELHQDQFNIDDRNINEQWIDFLDHLKYEGIYQTKSYYIQIFQLKTVHTSKLSGFLHAFTDVSYLTRPRLYMYMHSVLRGVKVWSVFQLLVIVDNYSELQQHEPLTAAHMTTPPMLCIKQCVNTGLTLRFGKTYSGRYLILK